MATQLRFPFDAGPDRSRARRVGPRLCVQVIHDGSAPYPDPVRGSYDVYAMLRDEAARWDREHFVTIMLDNKHHVIGIEDVSIGSLSASIVHPREIFKGLILANAAAFLVAHNHPSGSPTPSTEDIEITRRLRQAAEIIGIRFLDHIVIGRGGFVSFLDDGYW